MKTIIRNAALQKTAFFVSLTGYKNKKRVTAVTQYLVNLKSNTMKNTVQKYEIYLFLVYRKQKIYILAVIFYLF